MRISDWSSDVCSSDLGAEPDQSGEEPDDDQLSRITGTPADHPADRCADGAGAGHPVPRLWPRPAISLDVPVELQCRADQQSACHRRAHAARYIDGRLQADDDGAGTGRREYRGRSGRSEEHTSELQSLMRTSYAVFCLKKKKT